MVSNKALVVFQNKKIRRTWFEDEWYYSVIDIVGILTESVNPRDYWYKTKKRLKDDEYNVVDKKLVPIVCNFSLLKRDKVKGDVIISLACDAGVYNLKKLLSNKKVIIALDTIALGTYDNEMDISLVKKFK